MFWNRPTQALIDALQWIAKEIGTMSAATDNLTAAIDKLTTEVDLVAQKLQAPVTPPPPDESPLIAAQAQRIAELEAKLEAALASAPAS